MSWPTVLSIASSVSGLSGLIAVVVALYFRHLEKTKSSAIEDVAGEYQVSADRIAEILERIPEPDRLRALELLLSIPRDRANDVLNRLTDAAPSVQRMYHHRVQLARGVGVLLIAIAGIGATTRIALPHMPSWSPKTFHPPPDPTEDPTTDPPAAPENEATPAPTSTWTPDEQGNLYIALPLRPRDTTRLTDNFDTTPFRNRPRRLAIELHNITTHPDAFAAQLKSDVRFGSGTGPLGLNARDGDRQQDDTLTLRNGTRFTAAQSADTDSAYYLAWRNRETSMQAFAAANPDALVVLRLLD